jgi:flagellar biosynthesis protein FliR
MKLRTLLPKKIRVGYAIFCLWTVLAIVVVSWGTPLWATPSAEEVTLLAELLILGFVLCFAVDLLLEFWARQIRRGRRL